MKSDYWQRMLFPDGNGRIEEKVKKPDITRRRHKGEPFSEAANPSPESKSRDRLKIVLYLRENGGHTAEEVEAALDLPRSTVSARFSELKKDGMIIQIDRRPTSTGAMAGVYDLAVKHEANSSGNS